ncbi:MAG: DUF7544 domain-containing protein [Rubrobacteraceae bacterium]
MNYGDLIRDAFWISWRNKFLWFFGFFVAGGAGNISSNVSNVPPDAVSVPAWIEDNLVAVIATAVVLAALITLVLIAMWLISAGSLAESVAAIDRGEERRFGAAFRAGLSNVWRVLLLVILLFLIGFGLAIAVVVLTATPIILTFVITESAARIAVGVIFGVLGFLLLISVFIPYGIIGAFSLRALVVDRTGIFGGIRAGYRLFRGNIGRSLLVWLINLGLAIGVGIATLIITLLLGLVLFLPAILLWVAEVSTAAIIVAGVFGGLLLLPILVLLSGAAGTFFHAYWTLAYLRLTNRNAPTSEPGQGVQAA